jgi:hypothetical protein
VVAALIEAGARDVQLRAAIEDCYALPAPSTLARLAAVIKEAGDLGLEGLVTMAWTARATLAAAIDPGVGAEAAEHALVHAETWLCSGLSRPEVWLAAAHAFDAAGQPERAQACLHSASQWLSDRIGEGDVPPPFVESFLHRNPVHVALRARSARHAATSDASNRC